MDDNGLYNSCIRDMLLLLLSSDMMQLRGRVVDTQQLSQYQEAIPVRRTYQMSIIIVLL